MNWLLDHPMWFVPIGFLTVFGSGVWLFGWPFNYIGKHRR